MTENRLLELLKEKQWKITTAESCTGGLVAGLLCDISGISSYFEEGYITYSENSKENTLGVARETIDTYGVVSCETATEMAIGAARRANANCAIATTGIAGPTGGTLETPVGCVCFAWKITDDIYTDRVIFTGSRMEIRMQAASYALEKLGEYLQQAEKE